MCVLIIKRPVFCFSFILPIVLSIAAPVLGYANCTNPTARAGKVVYSELQNAVLFCDGTNWRLTGRAVENAGTDGCTNPTGTERDLVYNTTHNQMMFCNGDDWVAMGPSNTSATGTGCTNPELGEGTLIYNTTVNWLQYCDGDNWVNAGKIQILGAPGCPAGFAYIPGSAGAAFEQSGWCVSKYEMTPHNPTGWVTNSGGYKYDSAGEDKTITAKPGTAGINNITRNQAANACAADLVDGNGNTVTNGKLLTVALWQKIAQDITNQGINWSSGVVGTGYLSRGNANDNTIRIPGAVDQVPSIFNMPNPINEYWSRTYQLSNGEVLWDFAGNIAEWFHDTHNSGGTGAQTELNQGAYAFAGVPLEPANGGGNWTSAQGTGTIAKPVPVPGTFYAAFYGGAGGAQQYAGIWATDWGTPNPESNRYPHLGFRCIAPAQ